MVVYGTEQKYNAKKRLMRGIVIIAVSFIIAIIAAVLLCLFVNKANAILFEIAVCVVLTVAGWVSITVLYLLVLPSKFEISHLNSILTGNKKQYEGQVTAGGRYISLSGNLRAQEITVKNSDGKETVYYLEKETEIPIGCRVKLICCGNYICELEVIDEAV